jgi:hypothetical protein
LEEDRLRGGGGGGGGGGEGGGGGGVATGQCLFTRRLFAFRYKSQSVISKFGQHSQTTHSKVIVWKVLPSVV